MVKVFLDFILFAHENLAFRIRDFLWRVRRGILAVVILQQGFPTQLSAKKCVYWMLNFHVRRVYKSYLTCKMLDIFATKQSITQQTK